MRILRTIPLCLVLACSVNFPGPKTAPKEEVIPDPVAPEAANVPYDQAIQKSAHNAFERDEPLLDQLMYDRVRSLELDIHATKTGYSAPAGDWFVYHEDFPALRYTSCEMLSDCLALVNAFHRAVPQHEVITLWLDLKNGFGGDHDVADLDAAIVAMLGRENLVTPADLRARCPSAGTLRDSVTGACHFPTLADLRGKFIVALTGGALCNSWDSVTEYAARTTSSGAAFIAPRVDAFCPIESYDAHPDVIFFNMVYEEHDRALDVRSRGLVARVYRGLISLNNPEEFLAAQAVGANHIAMDMLNADVDPWAITNSTNGYPFSCDGCAPPVGEASSTIGLQASSGDLSARADSFYFLRSASSDAQTWTAMVSVPSSHVDPLAKGCLMARESDASDAAMVAICRPFDLNPPVMLIRSTTGGTVTAISSQTDSAFTPDTAAFLRLAVSPAAEGTDVIASTSVDGQRWTEVSRVRVAKALPQRGLAVAASGGGRLKALFTDVRVNDGAPLTANKFSAHGGIGPNATGKIFDGVLAPSSP